MDYIDMIETFTKILWEEKIPQRNTFPQDPLVSKLNVVWEQVSKWVITLKKTGEVSCTKPIKKSSFEEVWLLFHFLV